MRPFRTAKAVAVCLSCSASIAGMAHDSPTSEAKADPMNAAIPCKPGEEQVFSGEVQDDFGLSITVCHVGGGEAGDERLTVHYSGEGGGNTVSCVRTQCTGVIEFSHYVRPRFTIVTLIWRDKNGEQKLIETFDAQEEGSEPVHILSHIWLPRSQPSQVVEPQVYPVTSSSKPLSLLKPSFSAFPIPGCTTR